MKMIARTVLRLAAAATLASSAALAAPSAGAEPLTSGSAFGTSIGSSAVGLPDTLWAEGFGYLGATACTADLAAQAGCHAGQDVLVFQPVMPGRAGRVFIAVAAGRVAAIVTDLHYVAFSDG